MPIIERQAKRAILLTPENRVLLMRVDYGTGDWWITPGGGAEGDETPEQTLCRELSEELGLTGASIGPMLWRRRQVLSFGGRRWRQCEDFYLIETAEFTPAVQNAPEAALIREFRWWSLPEIRHNREPMSPPVLARIIMDYRSNGAPGTLEIVED